jgi:midasin (ATPase involved in ribosome maturation)
MLASNTAQLNEAEALYNDAYTDYGAWNRYISDSLKDGTELKRDNASYKQQSLDATNSATKFINYVDDKTSQPKAATTLASQLFDLGFNAWTKISEMEQKKKDAAIADFTQETKWQSWNEIKVDGPCPQ